MSKVWKSERRPMRSLDTALNEVLGPLAQSRRRHLERAQLAWAEVCGPTLARHTQPLEIRDRLLVVGAHGADWREALFTARKAIHRKLSGYLPSVRGIRVVSLPPHSEPPPPVPAPRAVSPHPDTADIADPGLRAAMDRLLHSWDERHGAGDP